MQNCVTETEIKRNIVHKRELGMHIGQPWMGGNGGERGAICEMNGAQQNCNLKWFYIIDDDGRVASLISIQTDRPTHSTDGSRIARHCPATSETHENAF